MFRVLGAKGSFFLNYGGAHVAPLLPFKMALLAAECGFQLQNNFHWVKSIAVPLNCGLVTLGQFRPVPSDRYVNDCHEFVFHLTKGGDTPILWSGIEPGSGTTLATNTRSDASAPQSAAVLRLHSND